MIQVVVTKAISAPPEVVFDAVANIENLPNTSADVLRIELQTEGPVGVGTKFREVRRHNGKEMTTDLEVTEYCVPERARMVTDSHGTVWDTVFEVRPQGDSTELRLAMEARPHKLLPKLLNPLMKGMFRKGIEKHMESVKAYCERASPP